MEILEPVVLEAGETLRCTVSYYDYGVVSVDSSFRSNLTGTDCSEFQQVDGDARTEKIRRRPARCRNRMSFANGPSHTIISDRRLLCHPDRTSSH